LKPYRGKPAVRNFRGDDGNVGIIRSPVRAIALPDRAVGPNKDLAFSMCVLTHRLLEAPGLFSLPGKSSRRVLLGSIDESCFYPTKSHRKSGGWGTLGNLLHGPK
jgi:hypothetical protein